MSSDPAKRGQKIEIPDTAKRRVACTLIDSLRPAMAHDEPMMQNDLSVTEFETSARTKRMSRMELSKKSRRLEYLSLVAKVVHF